MNQQEVHRVDLEDFTPVTATGNINEPSISALPTKTQSIPNPVKRKMSASVDLEAQQVEEMSGAEDMEEEMCRPVDEAVCKGFTIALSWENIFVYTKAVSQPHQFTSTETPQTSSKAQLVKKTILRNVSGIAMPGSLLAILGSSGAGKSTLLNMLMKRNLRDYEFTGTVRVNGVPIGPNIGYLSGYVQQDDLMFANLTVHETLIFRALLRMDKEISIAKRLERVHEVITEVGLSRCQDTRVGKPGTMKGISGGEAKRLSVACEILTNPHLLLLDEPTSGLDTFMAQSIVHTLKTMAEKHDRTVICTIHQPSSEIFAIFDQVLLMAEGRVAYMGSAQKALDFFEKIGYQCPINYNPADFFINTLAIKPGFESQYVEKANVICDSFQSSEESAEINRKLSHLASQSKKNAHLIEPMIGTKSKYHASPCQQFRTILWRSWISLHRDVLLFRVRFGQTVVFGLLMGLIFLQLEIDQKGIQNVNGALFLFVTNTTMFSVFAILNTFPVEFSIFIREYGSGLYSLPAYFISKNIAEFPAFTLFPVIYISIAYPMIGLYPSWDQFIIAACVLMVISNVAVSFGMLISTLSSDVTIALALSGPMMIPLLMFSGFFLNVESVPKYFLWMEKISWWKYGMELLAVNQWSNIDKIKCDNSTGPCRYKSGNDVMDYFSFSEEHYWPNFLILLGEVIGFRLIACLVLFIRAKRSKT